MRHVTLLLGLTLGMLLPVAFTAAADSGGASHTFCVGKSGDVRALTEVRDSCRRNETALEIQTGDFDEVTAALDEHAALLAALRDDLSLLGTDLGDLSLEVATLRERVDEHDWTSIELRLANAEGALGSLLLELDEQSSTLVTLQELVAAVQGEVDDVSGSLDELETLVASLQGALGDLDSATDETVASLETRINTLEAELGSLEGAASASDLAALTSRVATLETQMADVLTRLDELEQDSGSGDPAADADGDGFLAIGAGGSDCDDANSSVHPGAQELLGDGIDQDCDGSDGSAPVCDDANPATIDTWDASTQTCLFTPDPDMLVPFYTGPAGTQDVGICRAGLWDGVSTIFQAEVTPEPEVPGDGLDNDCDGMPDEANWFEDLDHDGYGTDTVIESASGGPGLATVSGDCDDSNSAVFPGAPEQNNGIDDDCDGHVDDSDADLDGDGYLAIAMGGNDCNDGNASVHPGADDFMDYYDPMNSQVLLSAGDGFDNDCDGLIDEETP